MRGLLVLQHVEPESSLNFELSRHMRLTVALLATQTKMLRSKTATLNLVLAQVNLAAHIVLLNYYIDNFAYY